MTKSHLGVWKEREGVGIGRVGEQLGGSARRAVDCSQL